MKKFKNGIHYEYVPLYRTAITFSTSCKVMCDQYGFDEASNCNGICIHNTDMANVGIFIEINDDYTITNLSTLAHESFHAAMAVGEMVGLEPTLTANEEVAYIISWIVEWVESCVEKEKKLNFTHK